MHEVVTTLKNNSLEFFTVNLSQGQLKAYLPERREFHDIPVFWIQDPSCLTMARNDETI